MDKAAKEADEMPETSERSRKQIKAKIDKIETATSSDGELDITSERFNPLKALYLPDYRVTEKKPKIIYQNMAAFETALKKVGIMGLNDRPKNSQGSGSKDIKNKNALIVEEEKTQRRFQEHQLAIKTQSKVKTKHQRNLMMQMAHAEGPLKKLQEYVIEGRIVKVVLRREHGIKGYAEGLLKMFDRHWNLLLVNVTETLEHRKHKYAENKLITHQEPHDCSKLLKNLRITLPKENVKSLTRKRVEIKRHLPQLLLRGEHVVLVCVKA